MEVKRIRRRADSLLSSGSNKIAPFLCVCVLLFSICALLSETRRSSTTESTAQRANPRRLLRAVGGPGSFPPRCSAKCGPCTPCFPVHVPVPRATPMPAEYYPEAWRCKCRDKLYMP